MGRAGGHPGNHRPGQDGTHGRASGPHSAQLMTHVGTLGTTGQPSTFHRLVMRARGVRGPELFDVAQPLLDRFASVAAIAAEGDRRDAAEAGLLIDPTLGNAQQLRYFMGCE